MEITKRILDFIEHIHDKGYVSKSTKPFLSKIRYYNHIWYLRDNGIIVENGVIEPFNQKKWVLTDRGKKIALCIKELKKLCEVNNG